MDNGVKKIESSNEKLKPKKNKTRRWWNPRWWIRLFSSIGEYKKKRIKKKRGFD